MKKMIQAILALAVLCAPAAADEPAPDANPCVIECKQECYNRYASWLLVCSDDPQPICEETTSPAWIADCKASCNDYNSCPGGGI